MLPLRSNSNKSWLLLALLLLATLSACARITDRPTTGPVISSSPATAALPSVTVPASPLPPAATLPPTPTTQLSDFSEPHPILGDVRVRQGIAYCTNKAALAKAVYSWLPNPEAFVVDAYLPASSWAYPQDDPDLLTYPFDPDKGRELFEQAGWTHRQASAYRSDSAGQEMALALTTTSSTFRKNLVTAFVEQMKACGLRVEPQYTTTEWFFGDQTGLARREFEIANSGWVANVDDNLVDFFACDRIPLPGNDWQGQNVGGWCSPSAEQAVKQLAGSLAREERRAAYQAFLEAFNRDLPVLSLFNRVVVSAAHPELENFVPDGVEVFTWNAAEWRIPGVDTLVIGERSEPGFPGGVFMMQNSYVNRVIDALIYGLDYTQLNGDYQPVMLKAIPSLENGLAEVQRVQVKEGEPVVGASGEAFNLFPGVSVRGTGGELVEYAGGELEMSQVTARFEFIDGLTWSDGQPVSRGDYELGYRLICDPASYANYIEVGLVRPVWCERVSAVDFTSATAYAITWMPGFTGQAAFLPPIPRLPAHQVLADGRKLAEVPAIEWLELAEVVEEPLGVGPYQLTHWEKGFGMIFKANPHYFAGPPATETIMLGFVEQVRTAAAFASGEVHVLGPDSVLPEQVNSLLQLQTSSQAKVYFTPSQVYEQLIFNLFK